MFIKTVVKKGVGNNRGERPGSERYTDNSLIFGGGEGNAVPVSKSEVLQMRENKGEGQEGETVFQTLRFQ